MIVHALRRLSLITRLSLTALLALIVMGTIIYEAIDSLHEVLHEDREVKTRHLVEVATGTVEHYHALQRSGALSEEEARQQAIAALKRLRYDGIEYFWIHDLSSPVPRMVMHPAEPSLEGKRLDEPRFDKATSMRAGLDGKNVAVEGKNLFVAFNEVIARADHGFVTYLWPKPTASGGVTGELYPKLSYAKKFEPWGWVIGSGIYIDDVRAKFTDHAYHLGILALLGTIALLGAALLVRRSILAEFGGEPGAATQITARIAEGDLTGRIELKPGDRDSVLFVLDRMQNNLRSMIREMFVNARKVESNIERLSSESNEINLATQLQASAIDQTRTVIGEVSASVEAVTDLARDTEDSSGEVVRCAQRGAAAAEEVATEMQAIAQTVAHSSSEVTRLVERTREVDRMASAIREIADQTNLLALNAAIEAARAGEQGRGFAVVADEVRKLAERTGQATTEITNVLHGIQTDTERAVAGMNAAAPVIATGVGKANQTAAALRAIEQQAQASLLKMSELGRATRAQTERIGEIVHNVNEVLAASAQTETVIQNSLETATVLESAANDLFRMVQRFDLGEAGHTATAAAARTRAKPLLEWSDRLSVGHRDIDRQHQRLIDIANKLNGAMHEGQGREVAGTILNELVEYTVGHFDFEEKLMKRHAYRNQDHHAAEHRKLLDEVGAFKRSFEKGNASISVELMAFIRDWLLNHILKVDKALARELAASTEPRGAAR